MRPGNRAKVAPDERHRSVGIAGTGGCVATEQRVRSNTLERWVPGIRAVRSYERVWLRADLVAGVVLAAILVPQGMAYAELAGLPPVTGLYTTIACLVGYAIFGPSRVLVLGPDSSVSPLIFAAITPLAVAGDPGDGHRARRDAGDHRRADRDRARARQARFRRRPALEGGPGRLHERAGDHHRRRPAAQAVRVLDRRRRLRRGGPGVRRRTSTSTDATTLVLGLVACWPSCSCCPASPRRIPAVLVAVVGATVVSAVFDLAARRWGPGSLPQGLPDAVVALDRRPATSARCSWRPSASRWCR